MSRRTDRPKREAVPIAALSDNELMRRMARLDPERYGAAYRETRALIRLIRREDRKH